ncbi:N-acetylmannosamine-6-phosphate 2-epimerase [Escherichia coli]|uniref:N-acylglucosamine-6-phosphate 2-epimerase n=1 Tax=Escherichia coli TaxID=562 RepID=A0A376LBV9_ECOLX|nr:N-acetylmannosamine-6-phosphate 2-epimerase [Escherichia coli]
MALAAEQAGAVAIRIEGVANLQATRAVVSVPIIGIVKRDLEDSPVRITAYIEDVDALAQAGADIIAIDGTDRPRPVPVETLLARIHHPRFTGDDRLFHAGRRPGMPKSWEPKLLALRFLAIPRLKRQKSRIWRW